MNKILFRNAEVPLPGSEQTLKYILALIDATEAARKLMDGVEKAYLEVGRHYESDLKTVEEWKQSIENKVKTRHDILRCFANGELDVVDEYLYVRFASGKETFFMVSEHGYLASNNSRGIF